MRNAERMLTRIATFAGALTATLGLTHAAKAEPRTHDGFYLQMDAGLGYLSSTADTAGGKATLSGMTVPAALFLGGTAGPIVIGGGFFGDYSPSPSASADGVSLTLTNVTMTLIGVGAFADYYVDPHGGLHFQPFVGWGGLDRSYKGNSSSSDPTGLVLALGGGYDWWVGEEWSIGVMGRIAYAPLSINGVTFSTVAPALLATFTYH
jgi:hypothetical protein